MSSRLTSLLVVAAEANLSNSLQAASDWLMQERADPGDFEEDETLKLIGKRLGNVFTHVLCEPRPAVSANTPAEVQ